MFDFSSQTVIVTGGTRGIGRGIAEAFLQAGARVVSTYASNRAAADTFRQANNEFADRLDCRRFDVSEYGAVKEFYAYIESTYENVEVLINNSGIRKDSVLGMMGEEEWRRVIDVNLTGSFNMCKFAVMNMMGNRYGRIINITSPSGKFGFLGQANYAASKAGMVALTKTLAKEVARRGITVNCISPGFIDTDLLEDLSDEIKDAYKNQPAVKRFGTIEEVAHGVLFLATRESSYITGTTLEITGGL